MQTIEAIQINNNDIDELISNKIKKNFTVVTKKGEFFAGDKNWIDTKKDFIYVYYDNGEISNRNYWLFNRCSPEINFNDNQKILIIEHLTITFYYNEDYEVVKNNIISTTCC